VLFEVVYTGAAVN